MLGYEVDPEDEALFDNAYIERIPTERSSKSALANLAENLFQVPKANLKFAILADQFKDLENKGNKE